MFLECFIPKDYIEIYVHFKNNPNLFVTDDDWGKIGILSDGKRLWYRVGAKIAYDINGKLGRSKLASLIQQPSENFINTYLQLKKSNVNKRTIISVSVLLIAAAIIMNVLIKDSNKSLDIELLEFFSGILFGAGITLPIQLFFSKKKKQPEN